MPKKQPKYKIKTRLQSYRNAKGITQQQLADDIGVTRATIISIEKENYNPSLELAFRLAEFFNTNITTLFYEEKSL